MGEPKDEECATFPRLLNDCAQAESNDRATVLWVQASDLFHRVFGSLLKVHLEFVYLNDPLRLP